MSSPWFFIVTVKTLFSKEVKNRDTAKVALREPLGNF